MKNKIMRTGLKIFIFFSLLSTSGIVVSAQNQSFSDSLLPVLTSDSMYLKEITGHAEKQMISLSTIPGIIFDLRYASDNNFMHKKLYTENTNTTFLRKPVYMALRQVAKDLVKKGIVLVIFDAYRPYSVTQTIWTSVKDERYAANPTKGSGHNRGTAVDLTLADAKTHQLLTMPTGFDNFSDTAHTNFMQTCYECILNRELLKRVMMKQGFIPLQTEWWHFSWPHPEHFALMDLSFNQLNAMEGKSH